MSNSQQAMARFADVPDVLAKIVNEKANFIAEQKKSLPLDSFINQLTPATKDMYQALSQDNTGFILECKKASPSKGLIRPEFNVSDIASVYNNYAAAISVLTEEKYFQGSFDYLKTVCEQVSCPVLNKDFFFDPYQVYVARYYGADAILLMLSVLNDEQYNELASIAQKYNMAVLTEVSNAEERDRAVKLNAKIIGINNRNLRDLSTDISQTLQLAPAIPNDRIVISESGIYTNSQVRELAPAVNGFLVGSSVMAEDDIDLACRKLIFGNHKVCGLTSINDAKKVAKSGAILGGLIFAEKSPRFISEETALNIINQVPELCYCAVFVNENEENIARLVDKLKLTKVQLHGQESAEYISRLKKLLPSHCEVVKALPVTDTLPEFNLNADSYLLDSKSPGSGSRFNWQLLANTEQDLSNSMLAGGLSSENITQALALLQSQELTGLDFNSGVESSPGIKDAGKLSKLFAQIRNY